jgi:hypothetical protein
LCSGGGLGSYRVGSGSGVGRYRCGSGGGGGHYRGGSGGVEDTEVVAVVVEDITNLVAVVV